MASRYGYVSRDTANRQIDWNAIGAQVSDGITKITEDRKERREDILTKSTDYAKMLIDMPMGSNTASMNILHNLPLKHLKLRFQI